MPPLFPPAFEDAQYLLFRRDEAQLAPGVGAIVGRLGLGGLARTRFEGGSLPVYAIGEDVVLKLYPPFCAEERDIESAVLSAIEDRLPIPTPRVHAVGAIESWGYVLMSRLGGESLAGAWPRLEDTDRLRVAGQVGEALAALHASSIAALPSARADWPRFEAEQRRTAVERQRARGLDEHWLEQIDDFLASVRVDDGRRSLLHTEVMREHLLVRRGADGWGLSGLFDFEPAMAGVPEYELASVGIFVCGGERPLLRQVLGAYGVADEGLDEALELRLMAHGILHRYSDLPWYFRRVPVPEGVRLLADLAECWWGVR